MKARYRNKVGKIVVELNHKGKWYYIKTLPDPFILFETECLRKCLELDSKEAIKIAESSKEVPIININRNLEKDTKP